MRENLRDELSRLTSWWSVKRSASIAVPPLVCTMLMEVGWKLEAVPRVDGLFMAPTLRPDGSLLAREGYDEETRLLLVGLPKMHRSEEHTSELQSLMRSSYAVFCLTKKIQ